MTSLWNITHLFADQHYKINIAFISIFCICGFMNEISDFKVLMHSQLKMKDFAEIRFAKPKTCVICWEKIESGVRTRCTHCFHL